MVASLIVAVVDYQFSTQFGDTGSGLSIQSNTSVQLIGELLAFLGVVNALITLKNMKLALGILWLLLGLLPVLFVVGLSGLRAGP